MRDSNNPLHEWDTGAEVAPTTWVFKEGSMTPSAKLTSEGNYSIFSNYLGVPTEAYDEAGKLVWQMNLDIYGNVREMRGDRDLIPFRFPGQYADKHSGLYYNRHRYYDPDQGNYTQIDPIGLSGGNPTLYGYVIDPNSVVDVFGLRCPEVVPDDTYAFGNATKPSDARPKRDFGVENGNDIVKAQSGPMPNGKSVCVDPNQAPLTGTVYKIPKGTELPDGLSIVRDGQDVIPGGHFPGHSTIFPNKDMPVDEFNDAFQSLPWEKVGKKK